MKVTLREYARMRNLSPSSVHKAIQTGRIKRDTDGKIDVQEADVEWFTNTDPAKQRKQIFPQVEDGVEIQSTTANFSKTSTYNQAKTASEYYKAMLMKERLLKYRGKLIDKEAAKSLFFNLARRQRDQFAGLPVKYGSLIAAELGIDEHKVMVVLDEYIRRVLAEGKEINDPFADGTSG